MDSERVEQPRANSAAAAIERAVRDAHARGVPRDQLEQLVATSTSLQEADRARLHTTIGELHGDPPAKPFSLPMPGARPAPKETTRAPIPGVVKLRHPQLGEPVRVYEYLDAAGELVFVVCRFEPGPEGEKKTFRQARLENGRWVWNLEGITSKPLYRLPRILQHVAAGSRDPIYVAAGEKDVEAIEAAGAIATCCPMGEGQGKWLEEHTAAIAGASLVTIVADYDDLKAPRVPVNARPVRVGFGAALYVYRQLAPVVATIDVVRAVEGKDSHDHLAAGRTLGELVGVSVDTLEFEGTQPDRTPPPATPDTARSVSGQSAPFRLTDLGNAERLVDEHGGDLRYVPQIGWHVWDGQRWRVDQDGEAHRRAKIVSRSIAKDAFARGLEGDDRKHQLAWAFKSEARARLEAMVALAETDSAVVVGVDDLDRDRFQLNTLNGTVDLSTGKLEPHDRADHNTKLAPVRYELDAPAPTWQRFLNTTFGADQELIAFVQRAVGYSLTGSTAEQVLFLLHGRGANGKSTFVETVRAMLGDYAQQAPTEMLMQQQRGRGGATPDLARLPGARFVAAVETGEGRRLDEPLVKQLTGGDRIAARRLYRDVFEFTPTHKLWLATNHLPQIAGTDDAIWRRIRLIPFTVTIPEKDRDPQLPAKLRDELPGILSWAVDGCSSYLLNGLQPPASITGATDAYRADMDELGAFLEECTVTDQITASVKASVLFTRYGYWADRMGSTPLSATAFGRALTERGMQKQKQRDGWHYIGIELTGGQAELN